MDRKEWRDVRNPADEAIVNEKQDSDLPGFDRDLEPETGEEAPPVPPIRTTREGVALEGDMLDADDRGSETEDALKHATEDRERNP